MDKTNAMLGSFGPKAESQTAMTPWEEAPSGMLARGHYTVKSKFVDDDSTSHLDWEWFVNPRRARCNTRTNMHTGRSTSRRTGLGTKRV